MAGPMIIYTVNYNDRRIEQHCYGDAAIVKAFSDEWYENYHDALEDLEAQEESYHNQ